MQKYSRDIVAEVLARCDIAELIGSYLELKPAGTGRLKACCPFHNEKTPSFTVSRDRQQFYCFGCQKHGDAISFLREYEGLTFMEALRKLADRGGVRLPALTEQDGKDEYRRTRLIELGKFAAAFFKAKLQDPLKGSLARQYLKTRALKPETVKRFALGYAPDGWSNLLDAARAEGFKDAVLEASGLAKRGDRGTLYDFFRNRLMVPIRDISGNVVAFGGRDLGDGTPKYINSPENAIYKKGRVLYGLNEARNAMRQEKRAVFVEGYFDLMRCFDAGIENVVATCGTALTPEQATLVHRYVPEAIVIFDADPAGIRAALRGIGLLTNAGLTVRATVLPEGKDPDDYIKVHGADAFRELIDNALDFVTFYVRGNDTRLSTIEGRTAVAREIFTILTNVNDELRREEYLKHAAGELRLNPWTCREEFAKFVREQRTPSPQSDNAQPKPSPGMPRDDVDFIAALLGHSPLLDHTKTQLASVPLDNGPVAEVLQALFTAEGGDIAQQLEGEPARALYAAAATTDTASPDNREELVRQRVIRLKKDALIAEGERIQQALRNAERANDQSLTLKLLSQKVDISKKIDTVGVA